MNPLLLAALLSPDVEALLDAWDVEAAERALVDRPRDARSAYLEGRVRFHRGDYDAVVRHLDAALAQADDAETRYVRDLAASAADATRGFVESTSAGGHFVLRASPEDRILLPYAGAALEAARSALAEDLGLAPPERIPVDVYRRPDDLARVSTLSADEIKNSGTIALCKWNRLMLVTPRALSRGYPWIDTLGHEYVHYVISRLTRNRVPIWMHEGIARRFEGRHRLGPREREPLPPAQAHVLFSALKKGALIPLSSMHPSMAKLPTQHDTTLAFAEVQTIIERLEDVAGPRALRTLLERIRDGEEAGSAFEQVAGAPMEPFLAAWKRSLRALGKPSGPPPLELAFRDPDEAPAGDGDERDPQAKREDRHERLGGLLRARGRSRAAAIEYEKAVAVARGRAGPFLLAKTARSHLEAGDAAHALGRAREALAAYPDLAGPHVTAGEAALRLGDPTSARSHLLAALRVSPFDPRVHCGLAEVHERFGDPQAAHERDLCRMLSVP